MWNAGLFKLFNTLVSEGCTINHLEQMIVAMQSNMNNRKNGLPSIPERSEHNRPGPTDTSSIFGDLPTPWKRWATVVFTDIEGFCRIMEEDETLGTQMAKQLLLVQGQLVPKYGGQIINSFGDGSLLLFGNTIQAVRCSIEIQKALELEISVPLRIGIHSGEVCYDGINIYGHNVNIASRLESAGAAGSILVSQQVSRILKAHTDIDTQEIGLVEFKNMKKSMVICGIKGQGLHVPSLRTIKSRGKIKSAKSGTSQIFIRSMAALFMVLIALLGLVSLPDQMSNSKPVNGELVHVADPHHLVNSLLIPIDS